MQLFELSPEIRAYAVRVFEQILFFDEVDRSLRGYARNRVTSKSGNVQSLKARSNLRRRDRQADRHAIAQSLCTGKNVRSHFPLLDAKPLLACAAPAGLH